MGCSAPVVPATCVGVFTVKGGGQFTDEYFANLGLKVTNRKGYSAWDPHGPSKTWETVKVQGKRKDIEKLILLADIVCVHSLQVKSESVR